jgi:hypothetical protein
MNNVLWIIFLFILSHLGIFGLVNWKRILFRPNHPSIPNLRTSLDDLLYFDSLTRGGLVIGRPGVGKTVWMAMQLLAYSLAYPSRPIFTLDASGSLTDEFIKLVYMLPAADRESILERLVYDRLGDPNLAVPMPFFSPDYGLNYEEQVQRVASNFKKLSEHLVERAPILGGLALSETAPELYRLLCAIQNEEGECWQITEAKKLLLNYGLLRRACKKYGRIVPEAKWYFEKEYLSKHVSNRERELRTYALRSILGMIEHRPIRARVGYQRPGWTPKEAIEKGLIVLVSGEELINQEQAQAILFTDVFSQILAQINKRTPHDPNDKHVLLAIDEVSMLLKVPGMAEEIGKISPQYRSRRLQILVVIQALWQLAENLKEQIWSLGNVTCFGIDDFQEAYTVAQQLFRYDQASTKPEQVSRSGQPVVESDRGQYLSGANWLQHLEHRECVLKRYITEGQEDRFVRHIRRTCDRPNEPLDEPLVEIKERLLKRRAIPVKEVLTVINNRKLTYQSKKKRPRVDTS